MSWIAAGDNLINLDVVTNIGINLPKKNELFFSYNDRTLTSIEFGSEKEAKNALMSMVKYLGVNFDVGGTLTSGGQFYNKEDEFGFRDEGSDI